MSIIKNTSVGVLVNILIFLISFFNGIVITRMLGPTQRGIYFLIIALSSILTGILSLGIGTSNQVFLAKGKYKLGELNSNSIIYSLSIGIIAFLCCLLFKDYFLRYLLKDVEYGYLLLGVGLLPFSLYIGYWNCLMVGLNRIILINVVSFFNVLGLFVFTVIVLVVLRLGVYGWLVMWFSLNVMMALTMLYISNKIDRIHLYFNPLILTETLSFGIRAHLGGIAGSIWMRLDSFLLNFYHGATQVGYYSLAVSLTEMLWNILNPLYTAITPRIAGDKPEESKQLTLRVTRHVTLFLVLTAVILALTGKWIIPFLYGHEFLPSVKPFVILLIGTIGVGIALVTSIYFLGQLNRPGLLSALAWVNVIINLILCFLLIPKYGLIGCAWAFTITVIIGIIIVLLVLRFLTGSSLKDMLVIKKSDFLDYVDLYRRLVSGGLSAIKWLRNQ